MFFILGFSTIFILMGASATFLGQRIALGAGLACAAGRHSHYRDGGCIFSGLLRINMLYRQARMNGPTQATGPLGGYALGLAFALGWTPCIGPILAAILPIAARPRPHGTAPACWRCIQRDWVCPFWLPRWPFGPL